MAYLGALVYNNGTSGGYILYRKARCNMHISVKPLLTFDELIEKMKDLGIHFDRVTETEAKDFLSNSNYFFKIGAFRKNFHKDFEGRYNIDFRQLQELARLDMKLRYLLLQYCLDIEHSIKTYLLRLITNDPDEDGYDIVQHIFSTQRNATEFKNAIFSSVRFYDRGKLKFIDGFQKYYEKPPVWVVLEIMTMSKLKPFIVYLSNAKPRNTKLKKIRNGIRYTSMLRNECAHNRPIIFNLRNNNHHISKPIYTNAKRKGFTNEEIQIYKVAQIFALMDLHALVCGDGMRRNRYKDFVVFKQEFQRVEDLFQDNKYISRFQSAINRLVDIYQI
ncbi:Abi family protein [Listeria booriae]|uniref:Abi family protein n=1 Tax=Listeria booriae TaxID=1552123 RepID=UPI001629BDEA|nr:Abi family protein [Listeria booriae]MBC2022628.1 Abi family protein [Listeria booriae]